MKNKEKVKRVFEVDEDEYYILKRAVDFLNSASLNPSGISSKNLNDLDSRLTRTKFEELQEVGDVSV